MRYRNSKPALILRWITLALIILVTALSYGDCLIRITGMACAPVFGDEPGVQTSLHPIPLAEGRYLMLAAALLLILRHYASDIAAGFAMIIPTLACTSAEELMMVFADIGMGVGYDSTALGDLVAVLAGINFALIWFMALVLKQPPKTEAQQEDGTFAKTEKNEKTTKMVIIVIAVLLAATVFRDVIVNELYNLLHGF